MKQQKFAVFDIDGTLIRGGLYRQLMLGLIDAGVIPEVHASIIQQKLLSWKRRESKDAYDEYELSLVNAIASSLADIPTAVFDEVASNIVTEELDHVYTYTRHRLRELKQAGYFLIAISGSQQELVEPFAKKYDFDAWAAQVYERHGDTFTGTITAKTYTNKDKFLQEIIDKHGLTLAGSYAFGDSEGDRHILAMVEYPVVFNPTEKLLEIAKTNGWPIVLERKSVVFELEKGEGGYLLAQAGKI